MSDGGCPGRTRAYPPCSARGLRSARACSGNTERAGLRTLGVYGTGGCSPQLVTGAEALAELVRTVVPLIVVLISVLADKLAAVLDASPQADCCWNWPSSRMPP